MLNTDKVQFQVVRTALLAILIITAGAHYAYAQANLPDKAVAKMTVTGMPGDNPDGTIEVVGINQQMIHPPPTSVTDSRPSYSIIITKKIDKASPKLFEYGAHGDALSMVIINWTRLNPTSNLEESYYSITLRGVKIISIRQRPADSSNPEARQSDEYEDVTFSFFPDHGGTVDWIYKSGAGLARSGWDFGQNRPRY